MLKWQIFAPFVAFVAGLFVLVVGAVRRAMGTRLQMGSEALVGRRGVAKGAFRAAGSHYDGSVFVDGARWSSESDEPIDDGQRVEVTMVLREPTRLAVRAATAASPPSPSGPDGSHDVPPTKR